MSPFLFSHKNVTDAIFACGSSFVVLHQIPAGAIGATRRRRRVWICKRIRQVINKWATLMEPLEPWSGPKHGAHGGGLHFGGTEQVHLWRRTTSSVGQRMFSYVLVWPRHDSTWSEKPVSMAQLFLSVTSTWTEQKNFSSSSRPYCATTLWRHARTYSATILASLYISECIRFFPL